MAARRLRPVYGPVESQVRADLDALVTTHPMGEALTAMSIALAKYIDNDPGMAIGAVNRQLRENLQELARYAVPGRDDLADELSAPVRNTEDSGPGDPGRGVRES